MSYQIYYNKAFIKVNDKIVPMVNSGSNNCWEVNFNNREIPEKNWSVLNHTDSSRVLFTADEVVDIANYYERISQESGICYKSRYKCFEAGEFGHWITCGIKNALTVEEYVAYGNVINIVNCDGKFADRKWYEVKTTEEFLATLENLKGSKSIDVQFENNREVIKPKREPKNVRIRNSGKRCYVLKLDSEKGSYFCSFRKNNITLCGNPSYEFVRTFATEKAALKYLEKYKDRLSRYRFVPVPLDEVV